VKDIPVFKDGVLHVPQAAVPRVHPNGMIQLDLNREGTLRLNVWERSPVSRQKVETPVHDHAFALESFLLYGCLRNFIFDMDYGAEPTHTLYRCEKREGQETCLVSTGMRGGLTITHTEKLKPGDVYHVPSRVLHWAYTLSDWSLTLMEKIVLDTAYRPVVAVPLGVNPDNDFMRASVDPDELWDRINKALFLAKINFVKV
jgi:hypothetical protein